MASAKKVSSAKKTKLGSPMKKKTQTASQSSSSPKKSQSKSSPKKSSKPRTGKSSKHPGYQKMITEALQNVNYFIEIKRKR
jgi:hypothetical protein